MIESIRAKGRDESDASRRERAAAAVGMLEELANDAAERAASGRFRRVVETESESSGLDLFSGLTLVDAPMGTPMAARLATAVAARLATTVAAAMAVAGGGARGKRKA